MKKFLADFLLDLTVYRDWCRNIQVFILSYLIVLDVIDASFVLLSLLIFVNISNGFHT